MTGNDFRSRCPSVAFWIAMLIGAAFRIYCVGFTSEWYRRHGSASVRGGWDFGAHPTLPFSILCLRDSTVAFFIGSALTFLIAACRPQSVPISSSSENI
jgi:hypothetical protein